ncbi:Tetratricopeptide repeat protein 28 [Gigaspora margarita]|uniref:Tetratricopeptide repeat protein 28 n=1 Tax=Gigaspora margarita TaxID=4874 RepID=A0A8H4AV48_GIGMA|nr:Tetratricopeptide repeat protein 28 [Gigaspora margarita]
MMLFSKYHSTELVNQADDARIHGSFQNALQLAYEVLSTTFRELYTNCFWSSNYFVNWNNTFEESDDPVLAAANSLCGKIELASSLIVTGNASCAIKFLEYLETHLQNNNKIGVNAFIEADFSFFEHSHGIAQGHLGECILLRDLNERINKIFLELVDCALKEFDEMVKITSGETGLKKDPSELGIALLGKSQKILAMVHVFILVLVGVALAEAYLVQYNFEFAERELQNVTETFDKLSRELLDDHQHVSIFEQMFKAYTLLHYALFQQNKVEESIVWAEQSRAVSLKQLLEDCNIIPKLHPISFRNPIFAASTPFDLEMINDIENEIDKEQNFRGSRAWQYIQDCNCQNLVIFPQGLLHNIPFAALPVPNQFPNRYLIEDGYVILYGFSIIIFWHLNTSSRSNKNILQIPPDYMVVVGHPYVHEGLIEDFPPLINRKRECERASFHLDSLSLMDTCATKKAILNDVKNASIIHFATHGSLKIKFLRELPLFVPSILLVSWNPEEFEGSFEQERVPFRKEPPGKMLEESLYLLDLYLQDSNDKSNAIVDPYESQHFIFATD